MTLSRQAPSRQPMQHSTAARARRNWQTRMAARLVSRLAEVVNVGFQTEFLSLSARSCETTRWLSNDMFAVTGHSRTQENPLTAPKRR